VVPVLVVAFVVVPLLELALLIKIGAVIGVLNTIALLLVMSVVGAWLMKREGLGVLRRLRASLAAGRMPGNEVLDGFLVLLGGALMLTPGFLSDVAGMALLLPPSRRAVRRLLARRFRGRLVRYP
jgi:UPF0716 protein FxsA